MGGPSLGALENDFFFSLAKLTRCFPCAKHCADSKKGPFPIPPCAGRLRECLFPLGGLSRLDPWSRSKQSDLGMHSVSVPQSPHECGGAPGLLEDSPNPGTLQPGDLGSGQHMCPLPAKQHPSAVWESIFQSQKSKPAFSPRDLQEATWERKGVLESHVLPGREEEVPGRQSLQGGLGGQGCLSLGRKKRSPN